MVVERGETQISDAERELRRKEVGAWVAEHVQLTGFEERDYQLDAWGAAWDTRAAGSKRWMIHLAPGLGKTIVGAVDMLKFREECAQVEDPMIPRALYVSHKHEINLQAAETMSATDPTLDIEFFNPRKINKRSDPDVQFATFQALSANLGSLDPQDFEYIIWDEAHHVEATSYKRVVEHFDPLCEYAITATPNRMDGKDIREYFGPAIYSKGLAQAIAEGWLVDVDYRIMFANEIEGASEIKSSEDLEDFFKIKPPLASVAQGIRDEIAKNGLENPKTIVFCTSIDETEDMAALMNGVPYNTRSRNRKQILQDFKAGRLRTLCVRDILNEGVDVPDTDVVVFNRGTDSDNVFEQQLGRGLRRVKGKEKILALDFVGNVERIRKIRRLSLEVRRHAKQVSAKNGETEGSEEDSGLQVSTPHGTFTFGNIAVNLLERWENDGVGLPPVGVVSIKRFIQTEGYTSKMVLDAIDELGLVLSPFQFGARAGLAVTPEQQKLLTEHIGPGIAEAEEVGGVLHIEDFAKEVGVPASAIRKAIADSSFVPDKYRFPGKVNTIVATGLTPKQQAIVRNHPIITTEEAPEGYMSITTFGKENGITDTTVGSLIKQLDMEVRAYRVTRQRKGGRVMPLMLSPAQQALLKTQPIIARKPPEGYLTPHKFAKTNSFSPERVQRAIEELGLSLKAYYFRTQLADGLSPADQNKLRAYLRAN